MLKRILLITAIIVFTIVDALGQNEKNFIDYGPAPKLVSTEVHLMGGGSTVTQNYKKIYPSIQNQNINMGNSWGIGAKAVFGIRDWLGLGTCFNVMLNHYNIDIAVVGADQSSMSAAFINNHNFTIDIPVYISFRFNVAHSVRWNVDGGVFYSYGFAGKQKQRIYRAEINEVDELVPEIQKVSTDYYKSSRTLFNVFKRGDLGLHIATSLDFGPHLTVGLQFQYGFKNSAGDNGSNHPSVHNLNMHGLLGYRF